MNTVNKESLRDVSERPWWLIDAICRLCLVKNIPTWKKTYEDITVYGLDVGF